MSAATVRAQLIAFLSGGGGIPYVNRWYADEPWYIAAERLDLAANDGVGAVAWPHITDETDTRETFPAINGQKRVTYKLSLVMPFLWAIPDDPAAEDDWVAPLDTMIEAVKARLRSDPKAGTGPGLDGVIFQQSQEDGDLHVLRDTPVLDPSGGQLIVWQRIDTTVTEIITA